MDLDNLCSSVRVQTGQKWDRHFSWISVLRSELDLLAEVQGELQSTYGDLDPFAQSPSQAMPNPTAAGFLSTLSLGSKLGFPNSRDQKCYQTVMAFGHSQWESRDHCSRETLFSSLRYLRRLCSRQLFPPKGTKVYLL